MQTSTEAAIEELTLPVTSDGTNLMSSFYTFWVAPETLLGIRAAKERAAEVISSAKQGEAMKR